MLNQYYMCRMIFLAFMLCIVSSCDASKESLKKDDTCRHQIHLLGGKTKFLSQSDLERYHLPRNMKNRIGYIDLSYTDLSKVNTYNVVPNSVITLIMDGSNLTDEQASVLSRCTYLDTLSLSATDVTDEVLNHLESLTKLKKLYLSHCNITDEGLKKLAKIKTLEQISLHSTHVTLLGAKNVEPIFPNIVNSYSSISQIPSEKSRRHIASLLRHGIGVYDSRTFSAIFKKRVQRDYRYVFYIPGTINVNVFKFDKEKILSSINQIAQNGKCRIRFGAGCSDVKKVFLSIRHLNHIFELSFADLSDVAYESLFKDSRFPTFSHWSDDEMIAFDGLKCSSIECAAEKISAKGFHYFSKIQGLENLDLFRCKMSNEILLAISKCKSLRKLSFDTIDFEKVSLEPLSQTSSLEEISFRHCKNIRLENIQKLKQLKPNLKIIKNNP